jgi:hypothetical protein
VGAGEAPNVASIAGVVTDMNAAAKKGGESYSDSVFRALAFSHVVTTVLLLKEPDEHSIAERTKTIVVTNI